MPEQGAFAVGNKCAAPAMRACPYWARWVQAAIQAALHQLLPPRWKVALHEHRCFSAAAQKAQGMMIGYLGQG